MWLINTQTLKLQFFLTPPDRYSILSHVWTDEECSFQEFRSLENVDDPILAITEKKGFKKIQACCKVSLDQDIEWTWVDTCCIDKTSSAELSESINSMFSWYKSSAICYAYLDDIDSPSSSTTLANLDQDPDTPTKVEGSRWYSRGWTLQELIAPLNVEFYGRSWVRIGSKWGLRKEISSITGIGDADLVVFDPRRSSIAEKMSWASMRKTTRVEDQAYSLLGLFGVHMSLLYGEGNNAFRRLQEELIRTSTDHTVFAWWGRDAFPDYRNSLLAESPADFRVSESIGSHVWSLEHEPDRRAAKKTYAITNGGLEIELPVLCDVEEVEYHLVRKRRLREPRLFTIGLLNCKDSKFQGLGLGVALKAEGPGTFRLHGNPIPLIMADLVEFEIKTLVLALNPSGSAGPLRRRFHPTNIDRRLARDAVIYRARIFAAKGLYLESVCKVSCADASESAAASFVKPTQDKFSSDNSTTMEVTAEGFYWFQVLADHASDSLVLNLSDHHGWSVSLQIMLSPTPGRPTPTSDSVNPDRLNGQTCRV